MVDKLERMGNQLRQKNTHLKESYEKNEDLKTEVKELKTQQSLHQMEMQELQIQFDNLSEQKQQTQIEIVREAPQIIRVKEPPIVHTEFKQDPAIIKLNQDLTVQIEESLQLEQITKERCSKLTSKNKQLENQLAELNSRPPKTVIKEKIVTKVERITPPPMGPRLELLFNKYKSYRDDLVREMTFRTLKMNMLYQKYKRMYENRKEKVIVNQKLEIVDGTFQVFEYMRGTVVKWILDIFVCAMNKANTRHMNSFKLFQGSLTKAKKQDIQNMIIMTAYARLKNLIQDEIPSIRWEKKYSYMNKELDKKQISNLNNFNIEKVKQLRKSESNSRVGETEVSELEEWVEDTLFCVVVKRRYGDWSRDQNVLFLFRLLAILYKVEVARATAAVQRSNQDSLENGGQEAAENQDIQVVDENLVCVLEGKIVNALMM